MLKFVKFKSIAFLQYLYRVVFNYKVAKILMTNCENSIL
ncbi:MAG: hypothetical protein JWQ84_3145 [Mucilaginibacter sp.]|nr:hypothetical protein [Mucilaginibacter sp.]MDB5018313.1 hypothetical protein [Mucilaginibacter sp.]